MKTQVKKTIRIEYSREITADDIRKAFKLPADALITFRVPGGGDWSNCDFGICEEHPIVCTWAKETTK